MEIRPAVATDVEVITGIYNHAVENTTASFDLAPRTVADRSSWLAARSERHPVLVAVEDERVIGWGALSPYSERPAYDATTEISIYVHPEHQRRGVGRVLSRALMELAPSLGVHMIVARICTETVGSIAMVRSLGFTEAGTVHEVGRKFGRWLDVVSWEYRVPDTDRPPV